MEIRTFLHCSSNYLPCSLKHYKFVHLYQRVASSAPHCMTKAGNINTTNTNHLLLTFLFILISHIQFIFALYNIFYPPYNDMQQTENGANIPFPLFKYLSLHSFYILSALSTFPITPFFIHSLTLYFTRTN